MKLSNRLPSRWSTTLQKSMGRDFYTLLLNWSTTQYLGSHLEGQFSPEGGWKLLRLGRHDLVRVRLSRKSWNSTLADTTSLRRMPPLPACFSGLTSEWVWVERHGAGLSVYCHSTIVVSLLSMKPKA